MQDWNQSRDLCRVSFFADAVQDVDAQSQYLQTSRPSIYIIGTLKWGHICCEKSQEMFAQVMDMESQPTFAKSSY